MNFLSLRQSPGNSINWQLIVCCIWLGIATRAGAADPALVITPDSARLVLDDVGLYTVGYQYRGQPEHYFPAGWSGGFEERTGVALQPAGVQKGRTACLLHPPWRGGTGVSFQDFSIRLPAAGEVQRITLTGATAMREDAMAGSGEKAKSDGATFRIFANGRALLDEHRANTDWKDFSFDLTELAGQVVTLRFETDPGPRNDASFDFALWGARELVMEGYRPNAQTPRVTPPALGLPPLYSATNGGVAPRSGFAGTVTMETGADTATLTYQGRDGLLDYRWTRPQSAQDPPLGRWQLRAKPAGAAESAVVPFAGDARIVWAGNAVFQGSSFVREDNGVDCVSTYVVNGQAVKVHNRARLEGKSLVMDLRCDAPQIVALETGHWGPLMYRRPVPVPYYSGQVFYLPAEDLFVNAFLDWTVSAASADDGTRAEYGACTDGRWNPLHERVIFTAAWHLAETLPNIPNPPSPYREHLAGKIILDLWGGRFDDIARNLVTLHDYGLNNCVAIVHVWQRSGYDNALPAHVPANKDLGGEAAMRNLVGTAKRLGYDIALHENYVDYYPNYEGFDPADIALDADGNRVKAWFNPGTKIQSFAIQPHAILRLAAGQSPRIRERYGPNADYLDVHSAVPPWFHVDHRAGQEGAAMFQPVRQAHQSLWAYERDLYHGPVFGEGNNHWYWSGMLDGVEAQFGSGWPVNGGRTAPLMVDFDLLKIHPLQFNHGMGYYERWWSAATWGAVPPMAVLDQYRMQEVIYGHAGFLGGAAAVNVPLAWIEHHLVSPVSARYGAAVPVNIEYQVDGRWVDGTAAAKAQVWNLVRVTYQNGLSVTANQDTNLLRTGDVALPQYGWLAQGDGVTAWTARLQDVVADFAETADSTFVNARPARDWMQSGLHRIHPAAVKFQSTGNRAFSLDYEWTVEEGLSADYHCFVHFVNGDDILFQDDHALPRSTSTWHPGETLADGPHEIRLPENLPDGDYGVRIGLYNDSGRLHLSGRNDGQDRICAGTVRVREQGKRIEFVPEPAVPDQNDIYEQRLNLAGKVLDFGDIRTDGSVLVRKEDGQWVLRALPRAREFFVELKSARFGAPASIRCVGGTADSVVPEVHGDWWQLKLNGATEYRW